MPDAATDAAQEVFIGRIEEASNVLTATLLDSFYTLPSLPFCSSMPEDLMCKE